MLSRILTVTFFMVVLVAGTVNSQFVWQRHLTNPVMPAWAGGDYALSPSVVLFDSCVNIYHMWFTSKSFFGPWTISHATSYDGIDWHLSIKHSVALTGGSQPFEGAGVSHATVIRDGTGYKMYYTGINFSGQGALGLATSTDGLTWSKYAGNPILTNSSSPWETVDVSWPNVYYNDSTYVMLYIGYDGAYYQTGSATSTDGVAWTKNPANPILQRGAPGSWDQGAASLNSLFVDKGVYYMFYDGKYPQPDRIGLATSTDGVTWTKYQGNPVFIGVPSGWDENVFRGSIILKNDQLQYWYSGNSGPNGWQIGYATSPFSPLDVKTPTGEVPRSFKLFQSFPNPFNPETTIRYEIPHTGHVTLKIYDAVGREIAVLVDEEQPAGPHSVRWNASRLSSGMYWYRLQAGGHEETRQMTLLK